MPGSAGQIDAIEPFVSAQVWALIQLQLLTGGRSGRVVSRKSVTISPDLDLAGTPMSPREVNEP